MAPHSSGAPLPPHRAALQHTHREDTTPPIIRGRSPPEPRLASSKVRRGRFSSGRPWTGIRSERSGCRIRGSARCLRGASGGTINPCSATRSRTTKPLHASIIGAFFTKHATHSMILAVARRPDHRAGQHDHERCAAVAPRSARRRALDAAVDRSREEIAGWTGAASQAIGLRPLAGSLSSSSWIRRSSRAGGAAPGRSRGALDNCSGPATGALGLFP